MLSRFANQLAVDALSQFIPHNTQHTSSYIALHTHPPFFSVVFLHTLPFMDIVFSLRPLVYLYNSLRREGLRVPSPKYIYCCLGFLTKIFEWDGDIENLDHLR